MQARRCLFEQACGIDQSHVDFNSLESPVHKDLVAPLRELKKIANENGFTLQIASGFRSFERQLSIWNQKAAGHRPVLDAKGLVVDLSTLSESEQVFAILQWSALPGVSRHHWGSEVDVFDLSAIDPGYQLQLTVEETTGNGPFTEFYRWLNGWLETQHNFFRPYIAGRGKVSPEPWHLSYRPVASVYKTTQEDVPLRCFIEQQDIVLKDAILENWQLIYDGYVRAYL